MGDIWICTAKRTQEDYESRWVPKRKGGLFSESATSLEKKKKERKTAAKKRSGKGPGQRRHKARRQKGVEGKVDCNPWPTNLGFGGCQWWTKSVKDQMAYVQEAKGPRRWGGKAVILTRGGRSSNMRGSKRPRIRGKSLIGTKNPTKTKGAFLSHMIGK